MKPLTKLREARLPNGAMMELWERDGNYLLLEDGSQVASSFSHGSDDSMTEIALAPVKKANQPTILIDGLYLGFVLAASIQEINREKASFIVAEPMAEDILDWHHKELKELNPGILDDPRVQIEPMTSLAIARRSPKTFHAIMVRATHNRLKLGVGEASDYLSSLREGGLLVISVARADHRLERTLQRAGFQVVTEIVPASHKGKKTSLHTLIIAKKGRYVSHGARSH